MPAKRRSTTAKRAARPVTARQLLQQVAAVQEARGLESATIVGALCEVIAAHQPTARRTVARLVGLLDAAGIR